MQVYGPDVLSDTDQQKLASNITKANGTTSEWGETSLSSVSTLRYQCPKQSNFIQERKIESSVSYITEWWDITAIYRPELQERSSGNAAVQHRDASGWTPAIELEWMIARRSCSATQTRAHTDAIGQVVNTCVLRSCFKIPRWAWGKQVHGMWYFSIQCFLRLLVGRQEGHLACKNISLSACCV